MKFTSALVFAVSQGAIVNTVNIAPTPIGTTDVAMDINFGPQSGSWTLFLLGAKNAEEEEGYYLNLVTKGPVQSAVDGNSFAAKQEYTWDTEYGMI